VEWERDRRLLRFAYLSRRPFLLSRRSRPPRTSTLTSFPLFARSLLQLSTPLELFTAPSGPPRPKKPKKIKNPEDANGGSGSGSANGAGNHNGGGGGGGGSHNFNQNNHNNHNNGNDPAGSSNGHGKGGGGGGGGNNSMPAGEKLPKAPKPKVSKPGTHPKKVRLKNLSSFSSSRGRGKQDSTRLVSRRASIRSSIADLPFSSSPRTFVFSSLGHAQVRSRTSTELDPYQPSHRSTTSRSDASTGPRRRRGGRGRSGRLLYLRDQVRRGEGYDCV